MAKSSAELANLFPVDSPYYTQVVFNLQLKWHHWRLWQAQALVELGFDEFQINGYGNTVAKTSLNVHALEVRVSYVIDRRHMHIYLGGDDTPLIVSDSIELDPDNGNWLQDTVDDLVGEWLEWQAKEQGDEY